MSWTRSGSLRASVSLLDEESSHAYAGSHAGTLGRFHGPRRFGGGLQARPLRTWKGLRAGRQAFLLQRRPQDRRGRSVRGRRTDVSRRRLGMGALRGRDHPKPETCHTEVDDDCDGAVNESGEGLHLHPHPERSLLRGPQGHRRRRRVRGRHPHVRQGWAVRRVRGPEDPSPRGLRRARRRGPRRSRLRRARLGGALR